MIVVVAYDIVVVVVYCPRYCYKCCSDCVSSCFGAAIADYTFVGIVAVVAMITDIAAVWQHVFAVARTK